MPSEFAFAVVIAAFVLAIVGIVVGSHLVKTGHNKKDENGYPNAKRIVIGWVLIAIFSLTLTGGLVCIIYVFFSTIAVIATILSPALFLIGIGVTLAFGISFLSEGISKDKNGKRNPRKMAGGIVSLSICVTLVIIAMILVMMLIYTLSHLKLGAM